MEQLSENVWMDPVAADTAMEENCICLTAVIDEIERRLIEQALQKTGGNRTRAGNMLSLTRQTLNYKIKRLNIRVGS